MKSTNNRYMAMMALAAAVTAPSVFAQVVDAPQGVNLNLTGEIIQSPVIHEPSQNGVDWLQTGWGFANRIVPVGQFTGYEDDGTAIPALDLIPLRTTSISIVDPGTGIATPLDGKNIYNSDGTLTGPRTVIQGANNLIVNQSGGGKVGIGTASPLTQVHIAGAAATILHSGLAVFNRGIDFVSNWQGQGPGSGDGACQMIVEGGFMCGGNITAASGTLSLSDGRYKKVLGRSESSVDLETLNKVQIKDYTYIDGSMRGDVVQKKIVAQDVAKIIPSAVVKKEWVVPSIYAESKSVTKNESGDFTVSLNKAHGLKSDDLVRMYTNDGVLVDARIKIQDDYTYTFATSQALGDQVFVYGSWKDDVNFVDYEALSMLNISATQELSKKIDHQQNKIASLEAENAELKKLAGEMKELKALVAALEGKSNDTVTVSLVK